MKPKALSMRVLGITRSKAKMYEYAVPDEFHIDIPHDPSELFTLTIGLLGEYAAKLNQEESTLVELEELRGHLQFSARFFDTYIDARLNNSLDQYLLLLGAATYYLCDQPGSAKILSERIDETSLGLGSQGLEDFLFWLLKANWSVDEKKVEGIYDLLLIRISHEICHYFNNGEGLSSLMESISILREFVYDIGSARELLFADVICAVVKKRVQNSTWYCLSEYTNLPIEQWHSVLRDKKFIREFWPAQHLLGKSGVFKGESAVVQMPTSAGKTKATEIILRSAFLSERSLFAVIVAPFRALCEEIKNDLIHAFNNDNVNINEISDVPQQDFDFMNFFDQIFSDQQNENPNPQKHIWVLTPEKLIYMLRQTPELAEEIGLLIYDEGHQFDSGRRGITYELLLTSLKSMVPAGIQTVLISAVISNASQISNWLNDDKASVVTGVDLIPTYRTIAFASWLYQSKELSSGQLKFIDSKNPDKDDFFVPRIINQYHLQLKGRERNPRIFPNKKKGGEIALYLGLKLVPNGSVAVFCGTKDYVSSLCRKLLEIYDRGFLLDKPLEFSNNNEISRLCYLSECNLGEDSTVAKSARLGVLTHHNNTPHGIRLSVEHSMKEGLAKFVICTSTLAQGVNLPIRYLLISNVYQGGEKIKTRDFHNLIGRVGRSGMHTEGSILFTDSNIYDKKGWRWRNIKEMLIPENSEPCDSTLLSFFEPFHSDDNEFTIKMEPLSLAKLYVSNPSSVKLVSDDISSRFAESNFTKKGIESQIQWKLNLISSIESYLLMHWDDSEQGMQEEDVRQLAQNTLAYFIADDKQKSNIVELFKLLAQNIEKNVSEPSKRKAFGKTLCGLNDTIAIENWVLDNIDNMILCEDAQELLHILWEIVSRNISNNKFRKCTKPEILEDLTSQWVQGEPYYKLLELLENAEAKITWGKSSPRKYTVEHVVDICENGLAYNGTLLLGAILEMVNYIRPEDSESLVETLKLLQKQIKYGLPTAKAITLYEMGFSDRVISIDVSMVLNNRSVPFRANIISEMRKIEGMVREILQKYPTYFTERLNQVLE